jgi:hypothetical protein
MYVHTYIEMTSYLYHKHQATIPWLQRKLDDVKTKYIYYFNFKKTANSEVSELQASGYDVTLR